MVYANQTHVHPVTKDQLYVATLHTSEMFQDLANLEAFRYHPHLKIITPLGGSNEIPFRILVLQDSRSSCQFNCKPTESLAFDPLLLPSK